MVIGSMQFLITEWDLEFKWLLKMIMRNLERMK